MRRLALAVLSVIAASACDPATHVVAHVTTAGACGGDARGPVEGAVVTLKCGGAEAPLGKTDAQGRFLYHSLGSVTEDCILRVTREGFEPQQYRVGDACATGTLAGHCPFMSLQPALRPVATSTP